MARIPAAVLDGVADLLVILTRLPEVHLSSSPPPRRLPHGPAAVALAACLVTALLLAACGGSSSSARLPQLHPSRTGPESMFTSAGEILQNPTGIAGQLKSLGVDTVHVPLWWDHVAPHSSSPHKPSFNASDPGAYPASGWAPYDAVVRALKAKGLGIDMAITAPPPRWAAGRGAPNPSQQSQWAWKPSAADYGQFVRAVATRYSGHYTPPGQHSPLPRVDFWSIWNEPDLGINMSPEAIDNSQIEVAPHYYRAFVNAAWNAFAATGHGHDTILIGELAPAGIRYGSGVGDFNSMPPLQFLRALYCVNKSYQPLRGTAATERGCPATPDASRFESANPGLFHASGVAVHPYAQGLPPDKATPGEPDYAELANMHQVEHVLDRLQQAYHSPTKFPIWSTEFGYQTTPPDKEALTVSPTTAAYYLNWAEYLTWQDPRLRSFDQYLLMDPANALFATGLQTAAGTPKPGYFAYRMPLYLPVTTGSKNQALVVWGCVRPAPDAAHSTHHPQSAEVQFRAGGAGPWRTVQTVALTNPHGYFEIHQKFSGSGDVRVAWKPPHGPRIYSRKVVISLR